MEKRKPPSVLDERENKAEKPFQILMSFNSCTGSNWVKHEIKQVCCPGGGGGVLPYMFYIGMCRCEGYGFQAVYSSIGYINQSVWV